MFKKLLNKWRQMNFIKAAQKPIKDAIKRDEREKSRILDELSAIKASARDLAKRMQIFNKKKHAVQTRLDSSKALLKRVTNAKP